QQEQEILFLFVGEGAVKSDLIKLAENKGLQNVRFIPGQPKEKIIDFYQLSDVCFVPLKDIQGFDTFIPSKMFEIMACEKPIIASLRGEAADILKQSGGALVIPPEDVKALVESIRFLKENPGQRQIMGRNGRIFVHKNYDRRKLALQYLTVLEKIRGQKTENRKNFLAPKKFSGKSK
ncbi:glycosyltransferase, partial [bacterium]|nr:glycosyltransferase [bacterium]